MAGEEQWLIGAFPADNACFWKGTETDAQDVSPHSLADRAVLLTFLAQNAANIIAPVSLITNVSLHFLFLLQSAPLPCRDGRQIFQKRCYLCALLHGDLRKYITEIMMSH